MISIRRTFLNLQDTIEDKNNNKAFDQLSSIAILSPRHKRTTILQVLALSPVFPQVPQRLSFDHTNPPRPPLLNDSACTCISASI
jgi:hypothetical protein